jgi:hypothetical protein
MPSFVETDAFTAYFESTHTMEAQLLQPYLKMGCVFLPGPLRMSREKE